MVTRIPPHLRCALQKHILNLNSKCTAPIHRIGRMSQLATAVRIGSSEQVQQAIALHGKITKFPRWGSERVSLVYCAEAMDDMHIFGVYHPDQIQQLGSFFGDEPHIPALAAMEINRWAYDALLEGIDLEKGLLITHY